MAGYRPPYSLKEDLAILRYVVDGNFGCFVRGNTLWKTMQDKKICPDRTWQSMKNRFTKTISIDLGRPEYKLTPDEKKLLLHEIRSINNATRRVHPELAGNNSSLREDSESDEEEEVRENRVEEVVPGGTDELPEGNEQSRHRSKRQTVKNGGKHEHQKIGGGEMTEEQQRKYFSLDMDWSDSDTE